MALQAGQNEDVIEPLPRYHSILLAVDSSDHSNCGVKEAITIAGLSDATITATHVYAAKMHDIRFRQMEGGLPEQFREEEELERQRDVHDDLITRGLSIITDSYLDQAEKTCKKQNVTFARRSLEGKNYRALVNETNCGKYDLLTIGSVGLGAIQGSQLGTVCSRVVRRSDIDVLVIKNPKESLTKGPIVVAVDGSSRSYGGLLTGLALAEKFELSIKIVSAFDPYYHYVAFNRIAGVLSEEAGKVFKFKEQEKLHEEIIDSGLAKIYQGHLDVAKSVARDYGMDVETVLLDGKPHDAIEKYLQKTKPSLLIIGKLGIHADPDLDIGGNAENMLKNVECNVLLSQREFKPEIEKLAEATTSWTNEAERRMDRVPDFVRSMARMAVLRYAQEQGHTVITESIVEQATEQLMPGHAHEAMGEIVMAHDSGELKRSVIDVPMSWSESAETLLTSVADETIRHNLKMRAEKKARADNTQVVEVEHVTAFLEQDNMQEFHWQAAALARLTKVPEGFMRDMTRKHIEDYACENSASEITLAVAEAGLKHARNNMMQAGQIDKSSGTCPFGHSSKKKQGKTGNSLRWSPAATARMEKIPEGFMRDLTRQRVETFARRKGSTEITPELIEEKYAEWSAGSNKQQMQLAWSPEAQERINRIPDFIRGMVIKEVEQCARELSLETVTTEIMQRASNAWADTGTFHSDIRPDQYSKD